MTIAVHRLLLQNLVGSILNGTMDWQSVLDDVLGTIITSPAGDTAASIVSDLLASLGDWLNASGAKPAEGAGNGGDDEDGGNLPSTGDLGGFISNIVDNLSGALGDIFGGGSGGDSSGSSDPGSDGSNGSGGVLGMLDDLLASLTGSGSDGRSPGDILNAIVASVTGGENSPVAGVDLAGLIPVLQAVLGDEAARTAIPGLIQSLTSGEQLDMQAVGPLIAAVLKDKEAAAQIPNLLKLLQNLGLMQ